MSKQTFTTGQVLTAAQVNALQTNDFNQDVSVKTASYVLVAADKGTRIEFNTSASVTVTVNTGIFDAGDTLVIQNRGAGAATVTAGTATVNTSSSLVVKQYDSGVLYFVSASSAIYFASDAADTPLTTKGDLFTFGTAADRLPVGTNTHVLTCDSSQSLGIKWAAPSSGGMTLLSTTTTNTGSSYTISSLSTDYIDLYLIWQDLDCTAGAAITMAFAGGNSATGGVNADGTSIVTLAAAAKLHSDTQSNNNAIACTIHNYAAATEKNLTIRFGGLQTGWRGGGYLGFHSYNAAITSITVAISTGSFSAGTLKIYGVK